jgi:hypothetical protein
VTSLLKAKKSENGWRIARQKRAKQGRAEKKKKNFSTDRFPFARLGLVMWNECLNV